MEMRKLSNENLNASLKEKAQKERELLKEILEHIAEVERRKLYLQMGYPSLFAYLTEEIGYDNGSAQRRLDAARLLIEVPSLGEKLESGSICLSQVTLVQKAIREKKKTAGKKIVFKKEHKAEILESISGLSVLESEKVIAETLNLEIKASPQIHQQKDESIRLEITFSKEQWEKLKDCRELLSTTLPDGSWDQVFTYLAERMIEKKTHEPKEQKTKPSTTSPAPGKRTHIPSHVQRAVKQRDQCCQYKNPKTGRTCKSKWNLQTDHIQPIWAGGTNEPENLQILCANHNRYRYKQQAGFHSCDSATLAVSESVASVICGQLAASGKRPS